MDNTQTQTPNNTPYVLFKAMGTGIGSDGKTQFGPIEKVGEVVKNEASKFESYTVAGTDLVIDKSKAGDYFLKAPNPTFDAEKPADFKTNNRYNIVTQLYKTLNKAGDSVYFRGTIGPKDQPTQRIVYRMFKNTPKAS